MPQIFQVLRCYKCLVFQIHQAKKSNKFECKMCGEKQSIKRHYGIGTSKDCRLHVQRLNRLRGELDELKENIEYSSDDEGEHKEEIVKEKIAPKKSKWSNYIDQDAEPEIANDTMYLDNKEMVLELPKRKKGEPFYTPIKKEEVTTQHDFVNNSYVPFESDIKKDYSSNKIASMIEDPVEPCYSNSTKEMIINSINTVKQEDLNYINTKNYSCNRKVEIKTVKTMNSKWTKYVNSDEENASSPNTSLNISQNNSNSALFSLCDDTELDDVLNF